jgi:hypothetical protein
MSSGQARVPVAAELVRALPPMPSLSAETVQARIAEAASLARRFTRGAGFSTDGESVHPELAAAIASCVARSLRNPSLPLALTGPPLSSHPGTFATWSDTELALMTRLRNQGGPQ